MKFFTFLALFLVFALPGHPQTTQVVQGRILDAVTKTPLPGAFVTVLVFAGDSLKSSGLGTAANEEGYYRLAGVPVGRVSLRFGMIGYMPRTVLNSEIVSGKELVLNIALQEQLVQANEVVITANQGAEKQLASNEFAFLSARGFDVEETRRYAGSRQDPSRMASNFAGVSGQNDGRNDIIIRGNSPTGLLWRLEGADIFNPSHFGALGATGGPVSMINNNVLEKSDFLTGAFPAEYGNALAGVFDLQMRSGNTEKHEFLGQIGFNGFELGAEGPLKKGSRASYLVNARYSTLAAVSRLGVSFGTGTAVPYYQDATFKIHVPTKKAGTFNLFGILGSSRIEFLGGEQDSTNLYASYYQNTYYRTESGVFGLQHNHQFSKNTWGQIVASYTLGQVKSEVDSLVPDGAALSTYRDRSNNNRQSIRYTVGHRFNARFSIKAGVYTDLFGITLRDSVRSSTGTFRKLKDVSGTAWLLQAYVQGQYRITERLSATAGLHGQRFSLGQTGVVEPRGGLQYAVGKSQLSLATGLHTQSQPLAGYFVQTYQPTGNILNNTNLKMTRAFHLVTGYSRSLDQNTRIKMEGYVQRIFNAPIEKKSSSYSMLNEGADFGYPTRDSLENKGLGRNIGVELTLERTFAQGYYFLVTGSLFDSKYRGSDGKWYNTAFNGTYIANLLAGKEWPLTAKSMFVLDIKLTGAGGRRFTPIDEAASRAQGQEVRVESEAFSKQLADYFRLDVKVSYRVNGKRVSQDFFVDVQNITNRENPYTRTWDVRRGRLVTTNQLGLFPNVNYRINF